MAATDTTLPRPRTRLAPLFGGLRVAAALLWLVLLQRRKPELLKATRKRRIAAGAGVQVQEVNRLLNEFEQMQGMMKKMKGGGLMKMMKRMGGMKGMPPMGGGGGMPRF